MTWGTGPWGAGGPWGSGSAAPPPTLIGVSPEIVDREGGTIVLILGTNFADDMEVEIRKAGAAVGTGYIFDPRFDVSLNRAYVGMPALDDGVYDLRVTTSGGVVDLLNALDVREHANEYPVVSCRSKWSLPWSVGPRIMSGG